MSVHHQEDFLARACGQDGCTHANEVIHLRAACHPKAKVTAAYAVGHRTLLLSCGKCGTGVLEVAVAARPLQDPSPRARANRQRTPARRTPAGRRR